MLERELQAGGALAEVPLQARLVSFGDRPLRKAQQQILVQAVRAGRCGHRSRGQQDRLGKRRTRVAVARKLAVLMHKLWSSGETFDWNRGMEANKIN